MPIKLLFIAKNWPEPNSTAAGRRTLDLLSLFQPSGSDIHVACAAEPTPFQQNLAELGMTTHKIKLNDSDFDPWIQNLNPDLVIFDRFVTEEQFGWRVHNQCPNALTILDTSDFHSLRLAREKSFKTQAPIKLFSETAVREISAMVRCDFTLMISQHEVELLITHFGLPAVNLLYLPFLISENHITTPISRSQRQHFVMIGGFKHEPNRDATRWLKQEIWPAIKKQVPRNCEMHIYGAYADHAMNQLHNPKERFLLKGRVDDALETLGNYAVNLARLRFGAGQKGKILEGWLTGTPTITTPVGAEAMASDQALGYTASTDADNFAATASRAFNDEQFWQQLQQNGYRVLSTQFRRDTFSTPFLERVYAALDDINEHRQKNFWGQVLWQNQLRTSEFMSRWIELKNVNKSSG